MARIASVLVAAFAALSLQVASGPAAADDDGSAASAEKLSKILKKRARLGNSNSRYQLLMDGNIVTGSPNPISKGAPEVDCQLKSWTYSALAGNKIMLSGYLTCKQAEMSFKLQDNNSRKDLVEGRFQVTNGTFSKALTAEAAESVLLQYAISPTTESGATSCCRATGSSLQQIAR